MTVLKVKAVAQAKIRELEGMLSQKGTNKEEEVIFSFLNQPYFLDIPPPF